MDSPEMLNNAKASDIKIAGPGDEKLVVKGNAFVRNLSAEVEWEEIDRESGEMRKYNSIISVLGWQWERHWNVYTEEAPFGLMLSELFSFLRSCIAVNDNVPSYINWGWDAKDFYIINMQPVYDHLWHRCLAEISVQEYNRNDTIISNIPKWDSLFFDKNEPLFIIKNDRIFLNADIVCLILKMTGIGGRIANSPKIKFNLIQYIKSFYSQNKILGSKLYKKISNFNFERTIWEDTGKEI